MDEIEFDIVSFSWNEQRGVDNLGAIWTVDILHDISGEEIEWSPVELEDVYFVTLINSAGDMYALIELSDYTTQAKEDLN